jgi:hypothetical protein
MSFSRFLFVLTLCVTVCTTAQAEPKPTYWNWWPSHWDNLDYEPYLENAKHPHNSQWNRDKWLPRHWEEQRADGLSVIDGFYKADILRNQVEKNDLPILVVGPNFYHLGGQDKRRVTSMIDYVYKITEKENGMYTLEDWYTRQPIGVYTRYGLQMQ